jgi:SAM-dependent methyltransferase
MAHNGRMSTDSSPLEDVEAAGEGTSLEANAERFAGFADLYDQVRPEPPAELADVLRRYCGRTRPDVVDLGSGSGLSTRWAARWARSVVGVEPSADMRRQAEARRPANGRFVEAFAHETGLPAATADVVLAVQAFHWMAPEATLAEVARLLRPGGVFAAVDCDWPPTVGSAAAESAWADCRSILWAYEARLASGAEGAALRTAMGGEERRRQAHDGRDAHRDRTLARGVRSWPKDGHLDQLMASGRFAWCHELALHHSEEGDDDRFVDLLRSQGDYQSLRRAGLDDDQLGVTRLAEVARAALGPQPMRWWFTYRVRLGVTTA